MTSPIDPTNPPSTETDLEVIGAIPHALAGRLVGIGRDGVVRSFRFDRGRVSYRVRSIRPVSFVEDLVAFDRSILVYGEDSSVRHLDLDLGTLRRVDLAGHLRTVDACPHYHAASDELHLVAGDWGGAQLHVVVPPGALTRRSRSIIDAPAPVHGLAIGGDHVVFLADGVVGVAARDGDLHASWRPTGVAAPWPVHTHRAGDAIVLLALTPLLERWTLHPDVAAIERSVLGPTPRRRAHPAAGHDANTPRWLWTADDETLVLLDLGVSPDAADRTDVAAVVHIPRPIPVGFRWTWMPATNTEPSPTPSPKENRP